MADIDPSKLQLFQFILFTKLEGAFTSALVHLGDRLGLYRAMANTTVPMTTSQLAHLTQLNERWVREWAYNQAAAKLISTENYSLLESASNMNFLPMKARISLRFPRARSFTRACLPLLSWLHFSQN